jgi:excisionase family DNA binding protein
MVMATTIPGMYNATEAARYLGISDSLVRRYCRAGEISALRFGRNWAIKKRELDRFKKTPRPVGNPNFRRGS